MGAWQQARAALAATPWRIRLLLLAIVLVPTVLLALRWEDPSRGQIPFGWHMHTSCWGHAGDPECAAP